MRLFHVSEEPGIERFEPRAHASHPHLGPGVWAVDETHLRNYLLPRDCPRVTFYAVQTSSISDIETYLDGDPLKAVVSVEEGWLERIETTTLSLYEMPADKFKVHDEGAGHFRSEGPIIPQHVLNVKDLPQMIIGRGAEFRTLPLLWPLFDLIVPSTLQFSMIRMRNAQPREEIR